MSTTHVPWRHRGTLNTVATAIDTRTAAPGVNLGRVMPLLAVGWLTAAVLLLVGWLALSSPRTAINTTAPAQVVDGIPAPNPDCVANTGDPTFYELRLARLFSEQSGQLAGYVYGTPTTLPVAKIVQDERSGVLRAADTRWAWACEK